MSQKEQQQQQHTQQQQHQQSWTSLLFIFIPSPLTPRLPFTQNNNALVL